MLRKIRPRFYAIGFLLGVLLLICLSLCSCSPEKRLARLIRHNPQLVKTDTIFRKDTMIINGVAHDTIFKTRITKDTIIIKDKQLTIKYYNDGTTTYLKGVCDTVRIIKEVPVIVNSVKPVESKRDWLPIILFGILALLMIVSMVRKK